MSIFNRKKKRGSETGDTSKPESISNNKRFSWWLEQRKLFTDKPLINEHLGIVEKGPLFCVWYYGVDSVYNETLNLKKAVNEEGELRVGTVITYENGKKSFENEDIQTAPIYDEIFVVGSNTLPHVRDVSVLGQAYYVVMRNKSETFVFVAEDTKHDFYAKSEFSYQKMCSFDVLIKGIKANANIVYLLDPTVNYGWDESIKTKEQAHEFIEKVNAAVDEYYKAYGIAEVAMLTRGMGETRDEAADRVDSEEKKIKEHVKQVVAKHLKRLFAQPEATESNLDELHIGESIEKNNNDIKNP